MPPKAGRWVLLLLVLPVLALAQDVTITPTPAPLSYGVLWFANWTQADSNSAFVNLAGAAYAPGNYLYTLDSHFGVIQLDAATGDVLAVFPNEGISAPSDVAADSAGNIYVADVGCGCILILGADGAWQSPLSGFSDGAPLSLSTPRIMATPVRGCGFFRAGMSRPLP
jgi:hypothetical protein